MKRSWTGPRDHAARAAAVLTVIAAAMALSGCTISRVRHSAELARASEPFQAAPAQPAGRLLVVGDSTAVGTGASSPAASVPGLLGRAHPRLAIDNRGQDGAKFDGIARQLEGASGRYDAVLIMGGGNDVIRLTGRDALQQSVERVARLARQRSAMVVFLPSGNVGNAPFFFPPVTWLMTKRSQTLHDIVRTAAASNGAAYVNLFKPRANDPFAQQPDRLNASDGLHPSDEGYQVWLRELDAQSGLPGKLPG